MDILKVIYILYAIIFTVESKLFRYPGNPLENHNNENKYNNNNCVCNLNPNGYATVSEILDPHNNGLERLVLYFYRDISTNEVKMFSPNIHKQYLIPDLPFESDDSLLPLKQELANYIFNSNSNKILLYRDNNSIKEHNYVNPFKTNAGNVDGVNYYKRNSIVTNIPSANVYYRSVIVPHNYPTVNTFDNNMREKWEMNIKIPSHTNQIHDMQNINLYDMWHVPEKNNYWEINTGSPENYYNYSHVYYPNLKHRNNVNNFVIPTHEVHNMNIPSGDKTTSLRFDQWFTQQMKRFQNVNLPRDIHTINANELRSLVHKTLRENNMFVTRGGLLVDSVGTTLDMSNLDLRPMFLGNPMEYPNPVTGADEHKRFPKDLPYLEGILVTLKYPHKLLGIIPLGKTFLYETSSKAKDTSNPIIKEIQSGYGVDGTLPGMSSQYVIPDMTLPEIYSVVARLNSESPITEHGHYNMELQNERRKDKNVRLSKSKVSTIPYKHATVYDIESNNEKVNDEEFKIGSINNTTESRTYTRDVLNNIYKILSGTARRQNVNVDDYEVDTELYDEEMPNYRIIGGQAATSSGSPVSNKGRSGFNL